MVLSKIGLGSARAKEARNRAIIDIGSNTVRLVIYGEPLRAPQILHNEKVTARLGKGVAEAGDLSAKAMGVALAALARYRAILSLKGVTDIDVVATAASRDARNGAAFLEDIRKLGLTPRLLSGGEEAVTSAHGVIGAFPGAKGMVGDLGGGSLELVDIDGERCTHGISLPLGTLRLPALRAEGLRAFGQKVGKALTKADWQAAPGQTLYLVGGSLRALARHIMVETGFPIDDPHGYVADPAVALRLAKAMARRESDALAPIDGVSSGRLASLPDTAALLAVLIARLKPEKLVFSAWGLREGVLWEAMPAAVRSQDPLVAGASAFAEDNGVAANTATMVAGWTAGIVPGDVPDRRERLRLTATMLCLASATIEPNLRSDVASEWGLRKRWIGATARDRAMLTAAMIANTGKLTLPTSLSQLASPSALREAQAWGLATRLCRRFSVCAAPALNASTLARADDTLALTVDDRHAALLSDSVVRDLKALATILGLRSEVRREG
ncbi:Ppx/GppA phosphatase family protein [Novosphingobium sp.]|uniref:Ppx/GppA phosphatase family protein n=1 Tax=Novosphingobium sp. TaxID=1874826 RepID=UPI002FDDFB41